MAFRITCINKDNGNHENANVAITHLGWVNESNGNSGKSTRLEMYEFIKNGGQAYVMDNVGNNAHLITAETALGTKYVKTKADSTERNNLPTLQECR